MSVRRGPRAGSSRADSAGCTAGFLSAGRTRHVTFFVPARSNTQITGPLSPTLEEADLWQPSLTPGAEPREGASVCGLSGYVDLTSMPEGTRRTRRPVTRRPVTRRPGVTPAVTPLRVLVATHACPRRAWINATGTPLADISSMVLPSDDH
ncbi:MAG: hypothetical protein HIU84_10960 [Acidobacteria bacterium]|nr:hypothetical protein [Acidobacteriota bacterium]